MADPEVVVHPKRSKGAVSSTTGPLSSFTNTGGVVDLSWLQLVSQRLEMRPLLNVRVKEWDDLQDTLARVEDRLLLKEPALYEEDYDEFMRSIKTAMFFL